jgi:hypothetical protein
MTAKCCGEWGWTDRTVTNLNPAVWRNPSGFFGACTNWSRRGATCGLDPSAPDQVYRIYANLLPTPTPATTPTASPSASEAQCTVIGSQPACNDTVITQLTDFVVNVGALVEPSSVQPSDFTVNGTPADEDGVAGTSITFHFNVSPVVQGQNTMHIPAGAFICEGSGHPVAEFTCTFTYQPSTPTPTATATPTLTPQPSPTPSPPFCDAAGSQPACNSTVFTQLTDFIVYISGFVGSLPPPSVFTVNGIPADTVSGGGSTLEFHFNASPVISGQNTMDIPFGAFTCSNTGTPFEGFHCTFTYQPPTPTPTPRVAPTARVRPTPPPRP